MKKKKKDKNATTEPVNPIEQYHFELQPPQPIFKNDGERDYFAEYYRAYKNDYIDQYLKAYREFSDLKKAFEHVDSMSTTTPVAPVAEAPATPEDNKKKKKKEKKRR